MRLSLLLVLFVGALAAEDNPIGKAVGTALKALHATQGADGLWPMEPGGDQQAGAAVGRTSLVLLAFLGAGYDHRMPSRHRLAVKAGIAALLSAQSPDDGRFRGTFAEHALATCAVAEAHAMTEDPDLRGPTERGLAVIRSERHDLGIHGAGWAAPEDRTRIDVETTLVAIMATKSAMAGGVAVDEDLRPEPGQDLLQRAGQLACHGWRAENSNWSSLDPDTDTSRFPASLRITDDRCITMGDSTAVGAWLTALTQPDGHQTMLRTLGNQLLATALPPPGEPLRDAWTAWLASLSMFHYQPNWERWRRPFIPVALSGQQFDGPNPGLWPADGSMHLGITGGIIATTACRALAIEVYYRYHPVDK